MRAFSRDCACLGIIPARRKRKEYSYGKKKHFSKKHRNHFKQKKKYKKISRNHRNHRNKRFSVIFPISSSGEISQITSKTRWKRFCRFWVHPEAIMKTVQEVGQFRWSSKPGCGSSSPNLLVGDWKWMRLSGCTQYLAEWSYFFTFHKPGMNHHSIISMTITIPYRNPKKGMQKSPLN